MNLLPKAEEIIGKIIYGSVVTVDTEGARSIDMC